ncbi:MAG: ATP-binding protein [Myxococcota bacterium]
MARRHLFAQFCLIFVVALLFYAIMTTALWNVIGHNEFEADLLNRTSRLAQRLLPGADAPLKVHQAVARDLGAALEVEITVFRADGSILASPDVPSAFPDSVPAPGSWTLNDGDTRWTTSLTDGRVVVVRLDRQGALSERATVGLLLVTLALFIAGISYPLIRGVTRRLERLEVQVRRVGSGDLNARVDVEGDDEIAALARSFNHAAAEIETLVTSQRLLLANTSHELRTPLTRIRLGVEFLKSGEDPERRAGLEKDIRELDELIDELLTISRLDTDPLSVPLEKVDLLGLVAEEASRYPFSSLGGEPGLVLGNVGLLQRLVRNLLENGIKHGEPPIDISVYATHEHVTLNVCDRGDGFSEYDLDRVLEPFYRGKGSKQNDGYGLGLSLVRRIVDMHGGQLTIANREDTHGATIEARFPRVFEDSPR